MNTNWFFLESCFIDQSWVIALNQNHVIYINLHDIVVVWADESMFPKECQSVIVDEHAEIDI